MDLKQVLNQYEPKHFYFIGFLCFLVSSTANLYSFIRSVSNGKLVWYGWISGIAMIIFYYALSLFFLKMYLSMRMPKVKETTEEELDEILKEEK